MAFHSGEIRGTVLFLIRANEVDNFATTMVVDLAQNPLNYFPLSPLGRFVQYGVPITIDTQKMASNIAEPLKNLQATFPLRGPKRGVATKRVDGMDITSLRIQKFHNVQVTLPGSPAKSCSSIHCCGLNVGVAPLK